MAQLDQAQGSSRKSPSKPYGVRISGMIGHQSASRNNVAGYAGYLDA
jgi:hypothetical protein